MSVLINREGKQLGPYTLDEARAMVLAGQLLATDLAWPDGAASWIPLKDVPGFVVEPEPGQPPAPTSSPTQEQELWSGHPSQILNLKFYLAWMVVLGAVFAAGCVWHPALWGWAVVLPIALLHISYKYFHLRATKYVVTTQRVRVIRGLFTQDIQEVELFRVKDTMVHQSFFLRLFGLGNITILSGDQHNPDINLVAIPGAMALRERLRQEVMSLRQRLGVRELDVM